MNELKHVCNMFLIRELVKVTSGEVKVKAKKKKKNGDQNKEHLLDTAMEGKGLKCYGYLKAIFTWVKTNFIEHFTFPTGCYVFSMHKIHHKGKQMEISSKTKESTKAYEML